ncbi:helix-turn-helix domain-containing protein [Moraxella nonliquefaciens]|jgi:hypothetical protein abauAB_10512|uniref:helix-turn-helix domain-containing protein n=1 Tax=Moraxella nonliquefaciens TaxID=478 RepID=UPI001EF619D7|nr:helix-turn-helix domain-containing protein [Moraxella nonliquefaciens]MCG7412051.1 helix-turn-helix domain-containing protein [Moraxella nonliquefaciens]
MITKDLLIKVGQALYGTQWQSDLARALDVDSRRVRQWLNDERPIPEWLSSELNALLTKNINDCQHLQQALASQTKPSLSSEVTEQQNDRP